MDFISSIMAKQLAGLGGLAAMAVGTVSAAPAQPLVEGAYTATQGNGPVSQKFVLIEGEDTAGTPGSPSNPEASYRNVPELTPDYVFLDFRSGWNNRTYDNNGRTGVYASRRKLVHWGQGDLAAYNASVRIRNNLPGATSWLANPAGIIINGTVVGEAEGVYNNPLEFLLKDTNDNETATFTATLTLGSNTITGIVGKVWPGDRVSGNGIPAGAYVKTFDALTATATLKYRDINTVEQNANATANGPVTITRKIAYNVTTIGLVLNMERHREAGAGLERGGEGIGQIWHGLRVQSRGTVAIDTVVSAIGPVWSGVDFTMTNLDLGPRQIAYAMRGGMRFYFNGTAGGVNDTSLFMREHHRMNYGFDHYWHYDPADQQLKFVINGNPTLRVSQSQVTATSLLATQIVLPAGGLVFNNGQRIIAGRVTGFTQMTGTANKGPLATYVAPAASAAYDQAQIQALMNAVQAGFQRLKAIDDAGGSYGGGHGLWGV